MADQDELRELLARAVELRHAIYYKAPVNSAVEKAANELGRVLADMEQLLSHRADGARRLDAVEADRGR